MALTIELSPTAEAQLRATAANGTELQDYISELLEREAQEDAADIATVRRVKEETKSDEWHTLDELRAVSGSLI